MIGRSGERGSGISMLAARHDDDDDEYVICQMIHTLLRRMHTKLIICAIIKQATFPHETSLKLVDKFTYQGSSVSSTEKDIDTWFTKAWTAIDRLLIIWKSELTDKMKRSFFQAAVVSILLYGCTT